MNQLTKNLSKRVLYIENKNNGEARIGWASFSKTAKTVYYKDKKLKRIKGGGISGNHYCEETNDEYWISGIKKLGVMPIGQSLSTFKLMMMLKKNTKK